MSERHPTWGHACHFRPWGLRIQANYFVELSRPGSHPTSELGRQLYIKAYRPKYTICQLFALWQHALGSTNCTVLPENSQRLAERRANRPLLQTPAQGCRHPSRPSPWFNPHSVTVGASVQSKGVLANRTRKGRRTSAQMPCAAPARLKILCHMCSCTYCIFRWTTRSASYAKGTAGRQYAGSIRR